MINIKPEDVCDMTLCFLTIIWKGTMVTTLAPNRYTKLDNLAWSQTVFLQFTFCRKHRFMKLLLLSIVAIFIHNTGCLF